MLHTKTESAERLSSFFRADFLGPIFVRLTIPILGIRPTQKCMPAQIYLTALFEFPETESIGLRAGDL